MTFVSVSLSEAESDLTSASFLTTFYQFIGHGGCPKTIFSDNGTNFLVVHMNSKKILERFLVKIGKSHYWGSSQRISVTLYRQAKSLNF